MTTSLFRWKDDKMRCIHNWKQVECPLTDESGVTKQCSNLCPYNPDFNKDVYGVGPTHSVKGKIILSTNLRIASDIEENTNKIE